MELERVLDEVRNHYLSLYRKAISAYRGRFTPSAAEVLLEVGRDALPVYRYYRMDLASGSTGPPDLTEVNPESHLDFEPLTVNRDGIRVRLSPIVWNGVEFSVEPELPDHAAVQSWALRWIDPDERTPVDTDGLGAYVHSITVPESDAGVTTFSIDFGSAPISSLIELLAVLRESGARSIEIHSRTVLGM